MKEDCIKIEFVKMTGAGNDFVLIDNLDKQYDLDWPKLSPVVCNRRYGIGADGLLIIDQSSRERFTMNYFNADGSYGGMCGNGGRCSALYAMDKYNVDSIRFEALRYIYKAEKIESNVKLYMKDINSIQPNIQIQINGTDLSTYFVDSGSPHVIVFENELPKILESSVQKDGIINVGRAIRQHVKFAPDGANVDFIRTSPNSTISMRTYERGVEDETLACGTGAVASAVCASYALGILSPVSVRTRSNETLKVYFKRKENQFKEIALEGPAKRLFQGYFYYSQGNSIQDQASL